MGCDLLPPTDLPPLGAHPQGNGLGLRSLAPHSGDALETALCRVGVEVTHCPWPEMMSSSMSSWCWQLWIFFIQLELFLFLGYCSVAQSCPTLCDPMDCSTKGFSFTLSLSLLKLISSELVMLSKHLILCHPFSSCLQSFPGSGSFPVSQLFTSGGQSIGASASASVLPMNI